MTFLVVTVAALLGLATVGYLCRHLYMEQRSKFQAEASEVKKLLIKELNSKGLKNFDMKAFADSVGSKPSIVQAAANELYSQLWDKVLSDGVITEEEKASLKRLATALAFDEANQLAIEKKRKGERYGVAVKELLDRAEIGNEDINSMKRLRKNLGLTHVDTQSISRKETKAAYLALFREIIDNSVIEPNELRQLTNFRKAFELSDDDANEIVRKDAAKLYNEWFTGIVNSGEINADQEQALHMLANVFNLPEKLVDEHNTILQRMKELADFRKGNIPAIRTSKLLESGESCYVDESCRFSWETQLAIKSVVGVLMITSNRIVFTSTLRSFEFKPSKIVDIELTDDDTIELSVSSSRGAGSYTIDRAERVAAILEGIVRRHNYILSESFSNAKSRHIPGDVRRAVWHRDGGACVMCKASDYLEYDHIIPFSKGGANTVGNVQLLCRKCNGEKSNRI